MYSDRSEKDFDNGFIYPIVNYIIVILNYLNAVLLFKYIARKIAERKTNCHSSNEMARLKRRYMNFAVDIFVIFKFLLVMFFWALNFDNYVSFVIVSYLVVMNVFTYFYHHVWEKDAILNQYLTIRRTRRRFINLLLSIFYMIFAYGYIYCKPLFKHYKWASLKDNYLQSLIFSVSNSFNGGYSGVVPITNIGEMVKASQLIMTFIFIAIILAKSIPQSDSE